jgi:FMN phosphatase YigB (HAD superfamily)
MEMGHARTGIRPRAVLFDLLTGLIDSWTLWERVAGVVEGRRWREAYLRKTYGEATYRPYDDLVREAAVDTGLPAALADSLVARSGELEPWPEVGEVLDRLAENVPLAVVTNCSEALGQLAAARIDIASRPSSRPSGRRITTSSASLSPRPGNAGHTARRPAPAPGQ